MNRALVKWLSSIKQTELPGIKFNIDTARSLSIKPHIDVDSIAVFMERDAGLAVRLMRRVNTTQDQRGRDGINSLRQAMMMIGIAQLHSIPRGLPTIETLDRKILPHYLRTQKRAYHSAWQASQWAKIKRDKDPHEIFLATMLNCIGELLLWVHAPEKMLELKELIASDANEADEAEYVTFGFSIDELTKELAKKWMLPPLFIQSLYPENSRINRILTVRLAVELGYASEMDWYSMRTRQLEKDIAHHLGQDLDKTTAQIHQFAAQAGRDSNYIRVPHQGSRLLWPAYELSLQQRPHELKSKKRSSSPGKQTTTTEMIPTDNGGPCDQRGITYCLTPRLPLVRKYLNILKSTEKIPTHKEVFQLTMLALHDGLGLNRVAFARFSSEGMHFKARSIMGNENDLHFNQFTIPLQTGNLFERLLKNPQPLWIKEESWHKYEKGIPVSFKHQINNRSFFVMPIVLKRKTVGLFYGDRSTACCQLDPRSYKLFQTIVKQANETLTLINGSK